MKTPGQPLFEDLEQTAKKFFRYSSGSHDWDHTLRVVRLGLVIGEREGADPDVVVAGAYLHDIGRNGPDEPSVHVCHAQRGASLAKEILARFPFSRQQKENIIHCIAAHRFRRPPEPSTLEAKVVFDADKLDAIGAVGIARAYLFAGEIGARLHSPDIDVEKAPAYSADDTGYREYLVKLRKIKDRMLTGAGKEMAVNRHRFMETFFKRFLDEYEGRL